ncbi:transcription initiation factor TFIID subunit [Penicillium herquei]|nr:transcription initiation factor TFIID subunit [Penicillium herquei]
MSAPGGGAPSPVPRGGSMGPGNNMNPQQPMPGGAPMHHQPPTPGPPPPSTGAMSQQNLNQIVTKKGYSRTEAMLRMESANQEIDGRPLPPMGEDSRPKYKQGFDLLKAWVEDNLDLYKPELRRVLWPLFVYSFLNMVASLWQQEAKQFFESSKNMFLPEHTDDIRIFEPISLPEHAQHNDLAVLYRNNKYRIVLSTPAYQNLLQFLESKEKEGGSVMNAILSSYCTIKTLERAADDRFSFATMLGQSGSGQSVPLEDEGIPGHHPGSAYTGDNPAMAGTLPRLRLGKMPMEPTLEGDVRHELAQLDAKEPPPPGRNTLINEFEQMIKREDDEESPNRTDVPFPPSTVRDVAVEVQKVQEHRDRFQIPGRTGGVAPAVSVCMFTLHNTYDAVTCIDISDDNTLLAAGFDQSFIRVWSLDGKPIKGAYSKDDDRPPSNSRRLVGHSGPVYAVAFQGCATAKENVSEDSKDYVPTNPRWLISASEDRTIRLWFLDTWACVAAYKGHDRPVFDVRWGPFGHYFVSGGSDRAARLWVSGNIRQRRMFVGHDQDVDCVCFHPNSAYVFTASSDKSVRMWAITTGNAVRMFTGHTGPITALECSPNGKILASADTQGSIFLWDLAPGRLLKQMRGHGKGGIWSLSFSAESTALVSGGADGTVRVWDVAGPQDSNGGRVVNDGATINKIDASNTTAGSSGQAKKKKGKDVVVSPDQISAFPTKKTPVYKVKFTTMNLVVAAGAYLP